MFHKWTATSLFSLPLLSARATRRLLKNRCADDFFSSLQGLPEYSRPFATSCAIVQIVSAGGDSPSL